MKDCYKEKIRVLQDFKGLMVKIRKLASVEKGLEEITRILTEEEIKKAINKGGSYIRKCSDPEPDSDGIKRNIDHVDSIELDKACIKKGFAPPLMEWHKAIFKKYGNYLDQGYLVQSKILKESSGYYLAMGGFPNGSFIKRLNTVSPISFKALVLEIKMM